MKNLLYDLFVYDNGEELRLNKCGKKFCFYLARSLFISLFVCIFFAFREILLKVIRFVFRGKL